MKKTVDNKFKKPVSFLYQVIFLLILAVSPLKQAEAGGFMGIKTRVNFQDQTFSLHLKNATIKEILFEIQKKTKCSFMFSEKELNQIRKSSFEVTNSTVEDCLTGLLKGTPYVYRITGNAISIYKPELPQQQGEEKLKVRGKVVDARKNPIAGATVLISGTTVGVASDANGHFALEVSPGESLEISFLGMESQKIEVSRSTDQLVVTLYEEVQAMEEVVVTGMFTRKAESFTGSAKTIQGSALQRVGNGNLFQSLRNLDPSLNIMENMEFGSDPNKLPTIQLRGASSFPIESSTDLRSNYQDDPNQPLFILDGFEAHVTRIFDLDMNRIQSITILKDAAAKAIYGSKAANGVVVVETKKPLSGELRVNYRGSVDITAPDLSSYNLADAFEKLEIERIAGEYSSSHLPKLLELQQLYNERMKAVSEGLNTNWLSKPLHTGVGTKHALSFEIGSRDLQTILDISYNKTAGVMIGSSRETLAGNINLSYRMNEKFLFRNIMSITSNTAKDSPYGSFQEYAYMNPYFSPYDEAGEITKDNGNPLYNATLNTKLTSGYLEFSNNFYVEYGILPNLKTIARIGVTTQRDEAERFYPANHTRFTDYDEEKFLRRGSYQQNRGKYTNLSGDLTLQYSKQIRKHFFIANFALNVSKKNSEEVVHYAEGFPSDRMDDITFALQYAENKKPYGSESKIHDIGFVGVLGYTYDDRFLLDFTIRENASSQFGNNNRWGTFWSTGIGWNIHNENWIQNADWFKQFKLRASVGTSGSQAFSSYQSMTTYKYYTDVSYAGMLGAYIMRLANNDLRWQQKLDYNAGFDARLWNFSLTFDYYQAFTNNLITDLSLPTSTGYSSVKENIGKIKNQGIDLSLTYNVFSNSKGFLNLTASVTTNRNKILKLSDAMRAYNEQQDQLLTSKLGGGRSKPILRYVEGGSLTSIWAVPSLGINPENGKEIYVKPDGTTTYDWKPEYQQIVGNSQEKVRGTFGLNGEYQGVGMSMVFRFLTGCDYYNQTLVDKVENVDLKGNVDKRVLYGRWSENNKNAPFKTLEPYIDADGNTISAPRTEPTSRFVNKRNELDIASLNVYYDMRDRKWLTRAGFRRLKISYNMNDIYKFSSIKMERGTAYPFARTMSISLSAEF